MDKMISEIADDEKVARIDDVSPDIDFFQKELAMLCDGCISSNPPLVIIFTILSFERVRKIESKQANKGYM